MEIEQQEPPPPESNRLNALSNTCLVRPKATGIVSLIAQFALVIISALVSMFFFYHVGGYEYMSWNENSTILEPIDHYKGQTSRPSTRTELLTTTEGSVVSHLLESSPTHLSYSFSMTCSMAHYSIKLTVTWRKLTLLWDYWT